MQPKATEAVGARYRLARRSHRAPRRGHDPTQPPVTRYEPDKFPRARDTSSLGATLALDPRRVVALQVDVTDHQE